MCWSRKVVVPSVELPHAVQVTFYSTQSVGTPPAPTGSPPSPAVQLLDPDEAAQSLATQAATNNTALFVTSPELVSSKHM